MADASLRHDQAWATTLVRRLLREMQEERNRPSEGREDTRRGTRMSSPDGAPARHGNRSVSHAGAPSDQFVTGAPELKLGILSVEAPADSIPLQLASDFARLPGMSSSQKPTTFLVMLR